MVSGFYTLRAALLLSLLYTQGHWAARITSPLYPAIKLEVGTSQGSINQEPKVQTQTQPSGSQFPTTSASSTTPLKSGKQEEAEVVVETVVDDPIWNDVKRFDKEQGGERDDDDGSEEVISRSMGMVLQGPLDPLAARLAAVKNLTICPPCPCGLPWQVNPPQMGSRLVGPVATSGFYSRPIRPDQTRTNSRQRRSLPNNDYLTNEGSTSNSDYWTNMGSASSSATTGDLGYSAMQQYKNRILGMGLPLFFGQINTGSAVGNDRAFGLDSDFKFPQDLHAFKYTPQGTRFDLNQWTKDGFPVYGQNLYTVAEPVEAFEFTASGEGQKVLLKGGYYTFDAMTKAQGNLMIKNIQTGLRYLVKRFFSDNNIASKLKAVYPWKDVNGNYISAFSQALGGQVNIIQGSPNTYSIPQNKPNQGLPDQPSAQILQVPIPPIPFPIPGPPGPPAQIPPQIPSPFPYPYPYPYPYPNQHVVQAAPVPDPIPLSQVPQVQFPGSGTVPAVVQSVMG